MERPKFNEQMCKELAIIVAGILDADTDDEEAMAAIAKVLERHHADNGYELAKEFEDEGYDMDVSSVDDLDFVSDHARDILKKHIKEWVSANSITLNLSVGAGVELKNKIRGQQYGVIAKLVTDTAQYGVQVAAEGISSTSCFIVNSEDITFVPRKDPAE